MRADREELRHRPAPRDRSVNTRAADVTAEGESTADGAALQSQLEPEFPHLYVRIRHTFQSEVQAS